MAQSPLQLKTYSFPRILCEADLNFNPGKKNALSKMEVEAKTCITHHPENLNEWRVVLDIQALSPDRSIPYKIDLQVIGFFEVAPTFPEDKVPDLVRITGSSILYSGAREFVLGITSRGPWPAVQLPTLSFVEPVHQEKQPIKKRGKKKNLSTTSKIKKK